MTGNRQEGSGSGRNTMSVVPCCVPGKGAALDDALRY